MANQLRNLILEVLGSDECSSKCLDNAPEREAVADELAKRFTTDRLLGLLAVQEDVW